MEEVMMSMLRGGEVRSPAGRAGGGAQAKPHARD